MFDENSMLHLPDKEKKGKEESKEERGRMGREKADK